MPLAGVGLVGEDADGNFIMADCARFKIDADAMQQTSAAPTSFTDVMTVQATGRRTMTSFPFQSIQRMRDDPVNFALQRFRTVAEGVIRTK